MSQPPVRPTAAGVDSLPIGTRFEELEILEVLGAGGFGIVYRARDHALDRVVAFKEYMPSQLAVRVDDGRIEVRSESNRTTFETGLRSFVNEARLLARFDHRALVKVYRFWEANGTAYMVMPYLEGLTLRETRRRATAPVTDAWLRQLLDPLLEALDVLHAEKVYHRDIAPDNILLTAGDVPVLLDFGAARRAIGDRTDVFTAILKPSYAPIEQYGESESLRQGPWTDLYAMGAVMHGLVVGNPPPPATTRAVRDHRPRLAAMAASQVSPALRAAIDWALEVRPQDRPSSVAAWRQAINGRVIPVVPLAAPGMEVGTPPTAPGAFAADPNFATTVVQTENLSRFRRDASQRAGPATFSPRKLAWMGGALAAAGLVAALAFVMVPTPQGTSPGASTAAGRAVAEPVAGPVTSPAPAEAARAPATAQAQANAPDQAAAPADASRSATALAATGGSSASTTSTDAAAGSRPPSTSGKNPVAAPRQPSSPAQVCSNGNFFSRAVCVERECRSARFASHPQCEQRRQAAEDRSRADDAYRN